MATFDSVGGYIAAFTSPQQDYQPSDVDEATTTRYYGFVNFKGHWFIRRLVTTTGAMTYTKGKTGYSAGWTGRAGLTYVRYNDLFA